MSSKAFPNVDLNSLPVFGLHEPVSLSQETGACCLIIFMLLWQFQLLCFEALIVLSSGVSADCG